MKHRHQRQSHKNPGITLISVVLISALIITAVLGVAQVLTKELSFSSDTINGERAYFAAESAVENANLLLKENPIYHGAKSVTLNDNTTTATANVNNISNNFKITLNTNQQQTIRLQKYDADSNGNIGITNLPSLLVPNNTSELDNILWTIRCKTTNDQVASVQGNFQSQTTGAALTQWKGFVDNPNDETTFNSINNETSLLNVGPDFWNKRDLQLSKKTCTLSLENQTDHNIAITVAQNPGFAPEIGTVTATGESKNRTKIIQYQTSQSEINPWLNWGVISQ